MGFDARQPTAAELDDMRSMVAEAMSAGAVGFSTGLEYSPGRHADEDELTALARSPPGYGGIYASHIRERGDNFVDAVEEALNIAVVRACRPSSPTWRPGRTRPRAPSTRCSTC